jgi:hypothetical protein
MSIKIWESNQNTLAEALELPEGRYVADFGINIEQSVEAQKNQIAFQDWAPLKVW